MYDVTVESTAFSPLRVGAGSLVAAAHLAALLALSLATPDGFELPLKKAMADAIEVVIVPQVRPPLPPPPMPSAPERPQAAPVPTPPAAVAIPSEDPVFVEQVIEASPVQTTFASDPVEASGPAAGAAGFAALTVLRGPQPPYPARAKRMGWQGEVVLRISIDADGWPREATVLRSSGHRELDVVAQRHVLRTWRFSPPGVRASGELPIRFTLL
ncbi:MAG: energy transducer TonB [Xanthomonadaceae bacterium]|nr:energy transducer TonB [Xanthomonadaceae bacterium]